MASFEAIFEANALQSAGHPEECQAGPARAPSAAGFMPLRNSFNDRNPFSSSTMASRSARDLEEQASGTCSGCDGAVELQRTGTERGNAAATGPAQLDPGLIRAETSSNPGSVPPMSKPQLFLPPDMKAQPCAPPGADLEQEWTALELDGVEGAAHVELPLLQDASFWWHALPAIATCALLLLSLWLQRRHPTQFVCYLEGWRWCLWLAGFPPIYYGAGLCVHLLELGVEARFLTSRQVMYYAVSIKTPAAWLLRAGLVLVLFLACFPPRHQEADEGRTVWWLAIKLLVCGMIAACAHLLKTLLAKLMASNFHKRAHFDKIQDALNKEYCLHALSQPRAHPPGSGSEDGAGLGSHGRHHGDLGLRWAGHALAGAVQQVLPPGLRRRGSSEGEERLHGRSGSTSHAPELGSSLRQESEWGNPLTDRLAALLGASALRRRKLLIENHRLPVDQLMHHKPQHKRQRSQSSAASLGQSPSGSQKDAFWLAHLHALEKHFRENKLRLTFADELGRAEKESEEAAEGHVNSTKEAQRLACFLFYNVVQDSQGRFITLADLRKFLPMQHARSALQFLDTDGDGRISLADMREAVQGICLQRKNLSLTLHDTHGVIGKLELIFMVVLHAVAAIGYLLIFKVDITQVWLTLSSVVLAFVFIFGNNIRNLYESVIFLFIVHPFDVGDCLLIAEAWHTVEEIALSVTTLRRWDGTRIWFPNVKLASNEVFNISRSGLRWEGFKVAVDISTPPEVFEAVDLAVVAHCRANPTEYSGQRLVVANYAGDPLKYTLCVWWEYAQTGAELGRLSRARHALYMAVTAALVAAKARYTLPPYEDMQQVLLSAARTRGEGQPFMPPFLQRPHIAV